MSKPRILVVEDEVIVARDICQQLIQLGYETVGDVTRAEEAVVLAGELRPDLVLMDIHLAGAMDGIAAAQTIREQFALPVVFLTAFASDEVLNRAKLTEPFGYIVKPFEERELHTVIAMALYKHGVEVRLRESHEEHAAILRSALDGFWLVDLQGRILEVNDACCRMHGCAREEMVGKSVGDFETEDTPAEIAASIERIMRDGSARFEGRHRRKDGGSFSVELSINYLSHSGGRFFAFMRDITERQQAEAAVRESERNLREAQRLGKMGSWSWDIATDTVVWSEELYRLNGYDPRSPAPSFAEQARRYTPEFWVKLQSAVERAVSSGEPFALEAEVVRADGRRCWYSLQGEPDRDASGKVATLHGTVQDITERKQVEVQLRRHAEELEASNAELTRFNQVTTDRELRMIELKQEINELCRGAGQPPRYTTDFAEPITPTA